MEDLASKLMTELECETVFTIPVFGVLLSNIMLTESSNVSPVNLIVTLVLICAGIITLNYNKQK